MVKSFDLLSPCFACVKGHNNNAFKGMDPNGYCMWKYYANYPVQYKYSKSNDNTSWDACILYIISCSFQSLQDVSIGTDWRQIFKQLMLIQILVRFKIQVFKCKAQYFSWTLARWMSWASFHSLNPAPHTGITMSLFYVIFTLHYPYIFNMILKSLNSNNDNLVVS